MRRAKIHWIFFHTTLHNLLTLGCTFYHWDMPRPMFCSNPGRLRNCASCGQVIKDRMISVLRVLKKAEGRLTLPSVSIGSVDLPKQLFIFGMTLPQSARD